MPAHACLLPRATLRELLAARGLVISADVPLVRSFSARRWVSGLAERLGRAGRPVERLADALPDGASLSLALHDERVILANRIDVRRAPAPLLRDRGGPAVVTLVLPAYEATRTIPEVAAEIPVDAADRALLVDDASHDATTEVALAHGFDVIRHPANRGYGGSQKTGYARALLDGADVIVMVHADNQYAPGLVPEMVAPILAGEADMVIGSRLLRDRAIAGGMPRWKWVGNRLLTGIENRAFGVELSEYHTGYRAFSADLLRSIPFLRNSDDFVFDQEIFAQVLARDARVVEMPIPTRYFREASSVDLRTSIRYGLMTLGVLARFTVDRRARPLAAAAPHRRRPRRPAPVAMRAARVGVLAVVLVRRGARAAHRLRRRTPGYVLRHDAVDYDVHARSIAQGEGSPRRWPTAARRRSARPATRTSWAPSTTCSRPTASRSRSASTSRASPRPSSGAALVALVGRDRRAAVGLDRRRSWRSAWRAIYLPLILVGGAVMSEPLFDVFMLASLAAVLAYRRSPHRYRWALAAGVLGGLAALTRAQALILLIPLALAVWDGRPWRSRARAGPAASCWSLAALLTITPWTIRNARELHAFVPISTQFGSALAGTYNDAARGDTQNPAAWQGIRHVPDYAYLFSRVGETNEAVLEQKLRAASLHYIREHPTYVAKVGWWNTRRMLDLAQPPPLARDRGDDHHQPLLGRPRASSASGSSPRSRSPAPSPPWRAGRPGTSGPCRS